MASVPDFLKAMTVVLGLASVVGCGAGGNSDRSGESRSPLALPGNSSSPGIATPTGSGGAAATLQIVGQPLTAVRIGESYEFQPSASDPDGEALRFSVINLPVWAQFDASTGKLSGTPSATDIGSYAGITLGVSNSTRSSFIAPFTLVVTQIATGTATVSWQPPLKNTDGSTLLDLHGFEIHFGRSAASLNQVITISNSSISRYVIDNLSSGAWYFAVSAVNSRGIQSVLSGVGYKVID